MGRLPNFLIIGAAKSGTTSLYHYLRQHPDVFMPAVKEPRFFAYAEDPPPMKGPGDARTNEAAGAVYTLDAYRQLFAAASTETAVGEASPNYLYSATAPRLIREHIPDAQLIAILRNPVERAYSHFLHLVRSGREPLRNFEAALDAEPERIAAGWEWSWHYRRMGCYGEQLMRYLEHVDREQLTVHLFEDFKADPVALAQDIFHGLGVDEAFVPDTSMRYEKSGVPKNDRFQRFLLNPDHWIRRLSRYLVPEAVRERLLIRMKNVNLEKPPLEPDVRERLTAAYRDDVLRLQDLIDRDLSAWLAPSTESASA
ncbi:MAG: sulfotransferase [Bacteroidetes bacterium]|jgi:hypothetical protein|nr:sulfotransferase [Bacteroidota bacterium]